LEREPAPRKSLVDQILEETLAGLEGSPLFEAERLFRLRKLAQAGELAKPSPVGEVLRATVAKR
jgi:hypothetical protein